MFSETFASSEFHFYKSFIILFCIRFSSKFGLDSSNTGDLIKIFVINSDKIHGRNAMNYAITIPSFQVSMLISSRKKYPVLRQWATFKRHHHYAHNYHKYFSGSLKLGNTQRTSVIHHLTYDIVFSASHFSNPSSFTKNVGIVRSHCQRLQ